MKLIGSCFNSFKTITLLSICEIFTIFDSFRTNYNQAMKSLPNLVAIVASFLIIFFLNYVFYGVVAAEFFENHAGSATGVQKEEVDMIFIFLGTVVQAIALTLLYAGWANGNHDLSNGARFGALAGLFAGFGMTMIMYGTSNLYDMTALLVDGIWYVFLYGVCGAVIALSMKKVNARST
jgi:hypothetical protein